MTIRRQEDDPSRMSVCFAAYEEGAIRQTEKFSIEVACVRTGHGARCTFPRHSASGAVDCRATVLRCTDLSQ